MDLFNYRKLKHIAGLLSKKFLGFPGSSDETGELKKWLEENPRNRSLYKRLQDPERYRSWVQDYRSSDADEDWKRISHAIHRGKRGHRYRNFYRAAALMLLLTLTGGTLLIYHTRATRDRENFQTSTIQAGSSKAILELNDGKSVVLDSEGELILSESDGTVISKSEGSLNYTSGSEKKRRKTAPIYNSIRIPRGGEFQLTLSDGSRVYLNSMSSIRYPVQFSGESREVEISGEAYFEIAKSQDIPFVVKTRGMNIRVLGTKFNINAYESQGRITTTLVEGSVRVESANDPGKTWILQPEEQSVFEPDRQYFEVKKVNIDLYTSWIDGEFNFYDERLEDIMLSLTRWYSAEVIFASPGLKELRFSGSLNRYEDIRQILEIIESTGKVSVRVEGQLITFEEKK